MGAKIRGEGRHGRPTYNQAAKIVAKFGGEATLARAVGVARVTVYRWQYAKPYGTGGLIPSHMTEVLQRAARIEGVILTPADWAPQRIEYPEAQSITQEATT